MWGLCTLPGCSVLKPILGGPFFLTSKLFRTVKQGAFKSQAKCYRYPLLDKFASQMTNIDLDFSVLESKQIANHSHSSLNAICTSFHTKSSLQYFPFPAEFGLFSGWVPGSCPNNSSRLSYARCTSFEKVYMHLLDILATILFYYIIMFWRYS